MTKDAIATVITQQEFLEHWQGHRALTRRTIEAFPEKELFSFSVGGMRPFNLLALEMIDLALYGLKGIVTGEWKQMEEMSHSNGENPAPTKQELLKLWDHVTEEINALWPQIAPERFHETVLTFGQYEGSVYSTILYFIDNEIHHRGQGYVYLRALGIEPPYFWER